MEIKKYYLVVWIILASISCSPRDTPISQTELETQPSAKPVVAKIEIPLINIVERKGVAYEVNKNIPFTGSGISYYPSGQWKDKRSYENGHLHGRQESYHENGQIYIEKNYVNGGLDGGYKIWDINGNIVASGNYKDNQFAGKQQWTSDKSQVEFTVNNGILDGTFVYRLSIDGLFHESSKYVYEKGLLKTGWHNTTSISSMIQTKEDEAYKLTNGVPELLSYHLKWHVDGKLYSERGYIPEKRKTKITSYHIVTGAYKKTELIDEYRLARPTTEILISSDSFYITKIYGEKRKEIVQYSLESGLKDGIRILNNNKRLYVEFIVDGLHHGWIIRYEDGGWEKPDECHINTEYVDGYRKCLQKLGPPESLDALSLEGFYL